MSTIKTDTLSNVAGTASVPTDTVVNGSAKAWVNFNGTGTVAIRAAFNVTSITDNGTGNYTVNLTSPMLDANACVTAICNQRETVCGTPAADSVVINTRDSTGTAVDAAYAGVAFFR